MAVDDHQIPNSLRLHLDFIADRLMAGHAAVMVGSGFSKNAATAPSQPAFSDWAELGDRFHERLHGHPPHSDTSYLQVSTMAAEIEAASGRPALDRLLREAIPDVHHDPSPLHLNLLELNWSDVLTTNYDTLLERALRSVITRRYDIVVRPQDLGDSTRPRIIKLHGSLPSHRPFIITDEDYRTYPQTFAPFVNTVRQALLENTLCLIGFSGDDPNFRQWVGWIHDNLGRSSAPKMYMIGVLSLSDPQRRLLERRNIIPVDMSRCPGVNVDHYQGLLRFLNYLCQRSQENPLRWPKSYDIASDASNTDDTAENPVEVLSAWESDRRRYPGWVVMPAERRHHLRHLTEKWLTTPPSEDALNPPRDLAFAFELTWRSEKCLLPIFDPHASWLETILSRYWDSTDPEEQRRCHSLLLSLMRYYREEGRSDDWEAACDRLRDVKQLLAPELLARFHHEQAMSALFALDATQLKQRLSAWQTTDSLPFWSAKKASLLAETGEFTEAQRTLEQALQVLRAKSNLTPTTRDYTLLSQESLIMFLLHAVDVASSRPFNSEDRSAIAERRRTFRDRWHTLRQYGCDPQLELQLFSLRLKQDPAHKSEATEAPTFDLGRVTQTYRFGSDEDAVLGYNFLRYCEDAAVPFQVGRFNVAIEPATKTLARIAPHSSHWALATLVRIGDEKAVEELFDRASLVPLTTDRVDALADRYLQALRSVLPSLASDAPFGPSDVGTGLARTLPEVLSRLCCKCSPTVRSELLEFLLDVYRSGRRRSFRGIRQLTTRLLAALSAAEWVSVIPKLLQFPILADLDTLEQREFFNPFDILDVPPGLFDQSDPLDDDRLADLFAHAAAEDDARRKWATTALGALDQLRMLTDAGRRRLASVLWNQTGAHGFPSNTRYLPHTFLDLPHPDDINPEQLLIRYFQTVQFPRQKTETQTEVGPEQEEALHACQSIRGSASRISWTAADVESIVERLLRWWDDDKVHFRNGYSPNLFPFPVSGGGDLRHEFTSTFAIVLTHHGHTIATVALKQEIERVIQEMREEKIPSLAITAGAVSVFPEWQERTLDQIDEQITSGKREEVVDALGAVEVVCRWRQPGENGVPGREDSAKRALKAACAGIRWRMGAALPTTLRTVGDLMASHSTSFDSEVEGSVLLGLKHLITDTEIRIPRTVWRRTKIDPKEVSEKLLLRRAAARLAYRTMEYFRDCGKPVPEIVGAWKRICESPHEFAEIRREWVDLSTGETASARTY